MVNVRAKDRFNRLTEQERKILALRLQGLSPYEVSSHIGASYSKLLYAERKAVAKLHQVPKKRSR